MTKTHKIEVHIVGTQEDRATTLQALVETATPEMLRDIFNRISTPQVIQIAKCANGVIYMRANTNGYGR